MDALTHAIEAYTTIEPRPIPDALNLHAIRLIAANLPAAMATDWNLEATANMLYASTIAGIGNQTGGGLGLVHGMAHALGGAFDLPHGVVNAVLLPWVMAFNLPSCVERFRDVAASMGEPVHNLPLWEAAEKSIEAVKRLSHQIGIPSRLGDLGVERDTFSSLAERTLHDPCTPTNPRSASRDDIIALFEMAL
jgi:alcohol dehydrogenase